MMERIKYHQRPTFHLDQVAFKCLPDAVKMLVVSQSDIWVSEPFQGIKTYVCLWSSAPENISGKAIDFDGNVVLGVTAFSMGDAHDNAGPIPTIHYAMTESDARRRGLAKRRTLILNQICVAKIGQTLRSSKQRSKDATTFWERLVSEGLAERITDDQGVASYSVV